jgi:hypothetical protein
LPLLKRPKSKPSEAPFFLRLPKPFFQFAKETNSITPFTYSWQKKNNRRRHWKFGRCRVKKSKGRWGIGKVRQTWSGKRL